MQSAGGEGGEVGGEEGREERREDSSSREEKDDNLQDGSDRAAQVWYLRREEDSSTALLHSFINSLCYGVFISS